MTTVEDRFRIAILERDFERLRAQRKIGAISREAGPEKEWWLEWYHRREEENKRAVNEALENETIQNLKNNQS